MFNAQEANKSYNRRNISLEYGFLCLGNIQTDNAPFMMFHGLILEKKRIIFLDP